MRHTKPDLILAIDGGGTRCRIAASTGDQVVSVETGSANVSTDFDGALHAISKGLADLADNMGQPLETLSAAPAFVGLAGVTGPHIADRLRDALPFQDVRIADDRPAAVRGILGKRDGFVGHCGTGSFYAAQIGGDIKLAGGWGPVVGDEASAQWVGRTALTLTLSTADGRLDPTPLSKRLLEEFDDTSGIVAFAGNASPSDFGTLAPRVTEAAAQGDAIANMILQQGADEIAHALRQLGWHTGHPICLTGGIGPYYGPYLPDDIRAALTESAGKPLDGAISLAQDFAQEIADGRG